MSSFLITNEGPLTDSDRKDLESFKNSQVFFIARKLMAHEYAVITEQLVSCTSPDQLLVAQGQLRGIKQVYARFLNSAVTVVEEKTQGKTLPNGKKILNIKRS